MENVERRKKVRDCLLFAGKLEHVRVDTVVT